MSFKPVNKKYLGYTKNKYEDFQKYKKDLQYKINRFKKPNYNSSFQNEERIEKNNIKLLKKKNFHQKNLF